MVDEAETTMSEGVSGSPYSSFCEGVKLKAKSLDVAACPCLDVGHLVGPADAAVPRFVVGVGVAVEQLCQVMQCLLGGVGIRGEIGTAPHEL